MADINNTSDITKLLSEYQHGQIQNDNTDGFEIPEFESQQPPMLDLVGMINAGPGPIGTHNGNKFLEAAMSGYGQSRFDRKFNYQSNKDLEDLRANEQAWIGKVTNGLLKGGVTTLTTAVNSTAGLITGLGSSFFELGKQIFTDEEFDAGKVLSAGVNNPLSDSAIRVQNKAEEWFPNYRTEEERTDEYQEQFLRPSHFFSGNFIGDSLLKNFGFTLGSIGGGMVWNKAVGKAFSKKLSSDLMKGVISATEGNPDADRKIKEAAELIRKAGGIENVDNSTLNIIMNNIKDAGKTIKTANFTTQLVGAVTAAMGEGTAEGLMAKNEFLESFIPRMDQEFAEAYGALEQNLYKEHPEWFITEDAHGLPLPSPVLVSDDGKLELLRKQTELADKYRRTREYAETQGDVLAKTTFLLNLPILMTSDLIQFGRVFGGDWTTARRNAPKVKGTFGKYEDAVGNKNISAALGSLKVGATEASEEMLQGFMSSGAKNIAETRLTYFKDLGYDPEAVEQAMDGMSLLLQGGKDYLGDIKNWQEGVIGALTGFIGIPARRLSQWNGGVIGEINRAKTEKEASKSAAEALNNLVKSDSFIERWTGYIRHMSYDNAMRKAVEDNDSYAWHSKDSEQLVSDVLTFASCGRLEDLKDFVDAVADINENDKGRVNQIREFLKGTSEKYNMELASRSDSDILDIKKQAKRMQDTIQDYYEVFSSLANVAPEDVEADRFKELMFTSMQLRRFESDFSDLLDTTVNNLTPYLSVVSSLNDEGKEKTRISDISDTLKELQSKYRQALLRVSVLDYLPESKVMKLLNDAEEEIKDIRKKITGEPANQLGVALESLQHMRKVADSRRGLIKKLTSLREMTNQEYDNKAKEEKSKEEKRQEKKEEISRSAVNSSKLGSVKDINIELLKRQEGPERDSYYESLKSLIDTNPAVNEFFKIEGVGADMEKVASKKFAELELTPIEEMAAAFILQYMGDNAESAEAILNFNSDIIPSQEEVTASFKGSSTVRALDPNNPMHKLTLDSVYNNALDAAKQVIGEINKARGLTKNMKPDPNVKAEPESETPPSAARRGSKKEAAKEKEAREKKKAERKAQEQKKQELEQSLSETPDPTPDPPTPSSTVPASEDSVPLPSGEVPKAIITEDLREEPVVDIPEAPGAAEPETSEDMVEAMAENNSDARETESIDRAVESGSYGEERQNYNMSIPEMSPNDIERRISGEQKDTDRFRTLPEESAKTEYVYGDVWRLLQDKYNAFDNADLVRPGDKVYFFIDPSNEEYDGEPQILMGIKRNGENRIYNLLRKNVYWNNVFSSWRGLSELRKEIIAEYNDWSPTEANPMFEFSKTSTVWARRAGFIKYNSSVSEDTPINRKKGFREDAIIFTIDKEWQYRQLSGKKVSDVGLLLPNAFKKNIDKKRKEDSENVVGNVYYLANGKDNSFIPIRLNVEHFTLDNKDSEGYGFDQIHKVSDDLADLAHEYYSEISDARKAIENNVYKDKKARNTALSTAIDEITDKFAAKKSEIAKELEKVLDIHGVIITLGVMGQKQGVYLPTLRFGVYQDAKDETGDYVRGELDEDTLINLIAEGVEPSKISEWFASIGRPFNIKFPGGTEEVDRQITDHVSSMAKFGLLTSNTETMRAQGIDIYIDSFNPDSKVRQFDKGKREDYNPSGPSIDENYAEDNAGIETSNNTPMSQNGAQETASAKVESGQDEPAKLTYDSLSDEQKNELEQLGIYAEAFDELDYSTQEELIRCNT